MGNTNFGHHTSKILIFIAIATVVLLGCWVYMHTQRFVLLSPLEGIESLPSPTPTEIIETPTPTPSPTPTKKITPKPTPSPKPQPQFTQSQIYGFTEQYGILYAVDPNVIRSVVLCESALNPNAKKSIYAGLFQFDTRTWITYRQKMGLDADPDLRFNAEESIKTGTYILSLGKKNLWPNCYPR